MQNEQEISVIGNPIQRKTEQAPAAQAEQEFVKKILSQIAEGKEFFKDDFKRMRDDMRLVRKGGDDDQLGDEFYLANLIKRHIQQRTAALYAKNPKAEAKVRDKLIYRVWDGKPETLMQAQVMTQTLQAGSAAHTMALNVIQDYAKGHQRKKMLQGVADTLTHLFEYSMAEQVPNFKVQMKQAVRRALTCSVAYVMIDFQRKFEKNPAISSQIADHMQRLGTIEKLMSEADEGGITANDADAEQLRQALEQLRAEEEILSREGLVFHFPYATEIIIDPDCTNLKGFIGAAWVAREIPMTKDEIKRDYGVDVSGGADRDMVRTTDNTIEATHYRDVRKQKDKSYVLVYEYFHRPTGRVYTVAEGYDRYLKQPKAPNARVDQFFPIFPLTFNDIEDEGSLYPPSDVTTLRPIQRAYNTSRQGLVEHRRASRPKWIASSDIEDDDLELLGNHPANAVLSVKSLQPGAKVADLLQAVPNYPIDQNIYQTEQYLSDMQLTVGSSESALGSTSGATATESAIAQNSRSTAMGSNIDDLDDFLTEISRAGGQVLLENMSPDMVTEIVGPGAVWPSLSRKEIISEVHLAVEAGSSGRPNKAEELANLERATPLLTQLPGINPVELTKLVLKRLDDKLDLEALIDPAAPSLAAMNRASAAPTGDPRTDPTMQGDPMMQQQGMNNPGGGSIAPMGNNQGLS